MPLKHRPALAVSNAVLLEGKVLPRLLFACKPAKEGICSANAAVFEPVSPSKFRTPRPAPCLYPMFEILRHYLTCVFIAAYLDMSGSFMWDFASVGLSLQTSRGLTSLLITI
jgi:hypothetical protein